MIALKAKASQHFKQHEVRNDDADFSVIEQMFEQCGRGCIRIVEKVDPHRRINDQHGACPRVPV